MHESSLANFWKINTDLIKVQRLISFHFIDFLNIIMKICAPECFNRSTLSLAISPKFPQGDILGTILVLFYYSTVEKPKKFFT